MASPQPVDEHLQYYCPDCSRPACKNWKYFVDGHEKDCKAVEEHGRKGLIWVFDGLRNTGRRIVFSRRQDYPEYEDRSIATGRPGKKQRGATAAGGPATPASAPASTHASTTREQLFKYAQQLWLALLYYMVGPVPLGQAVIQILDQLAELRLLENSLRGCVDLCMQNCVGCGLRLALEAWQVTDTPEPAGNLVCRVCLPAHGGPDPTHLRLLSDADHERVVQFVHQRIVTSEGDCSELSVRGSAVLATLAQDWLACLGSRTPTISKSTVVGGTEVVCGGVKSLLPAILPTEQRRALQALEEGKRLPPGLRQELASMEQAILGDRKLRRYDSLAAALSAASGPTCVSFSCNVRLPTAASQAVREADPQRVAEQDEMISRVKSMQRLLLAAAPPDHEGFCAAFEQLTDPGTLTLLIFGRRNQGTPWHVDGATAINMAYATSEKNAGKVCAQWALVRPGAVQELEKQLVILSGRKWAGSLGSKPKLLPPEVVEKLQRHMSTTDFLVFNQKPGEVVTVPCGWPHQVYNLEDCVKIACDVSRPDELASCLASWELVWCGIMKQNVSDYVCAAAGMIKAIVSISGRI